MPRAQNGRRTQLLAIMTLGVMLVMSFLWLVGPHMGHHDGGCIPASLISSDCPKTKNSLALSSHAGALRQFTEVTVVGQPSRLIILALALFGVLATVGRPGPVSAFVISRSSREHWRVPKQLRFNHWLALHESSPSLII